MAEPSERAKLAEETERRIRLRLETIEQRIVVFSGKGGVGKTTVAVNLAFALMKSGNRVGLLDADVTGPDVPAMIGLRGGPAAGEDGLMVPPERHGLKVMSSASMIPPASPIIWRGPLRARFLDQFLGDTDWGRLEYLVADLPPGTGDEVLTIAQRMEPQLAIIVTTPQELSLVDSRRAVNMAKALKVGRIGVVENMSGLRCPDCGRRIELFGSGGGERVARELDVRFLGRVPIDVRVREEADRGQPIVLRDEQADVSQAFAALAESVVELLAPASLPDRPATPYG